MDRSKLIREVLKLDGVAAANIQEPSEGDLERVLNANAVLSQKLEIAMAGLRKMHIDECGHNLNDLSEENVKTMVDWHKQNNRLIEITIQKIEAL